MRGNQKYRILKLEYYSESVKSSHVSHFYDIFSINFANISLQHYPSNYYFAQLFLFVTIFVFSMSYSATKTVIRLCKILSKQLLLFIATIFVLMSYSATKTDIRLFSVVFPLYITLVRLGAHISVVDCANSLCKAVVSAARAPQRGPLGGRVQCHYEGGTLTGASNEPSQRFHSHIQDIMLDGCMPESAFNQEKVLIFAKVHCELQHLHRHWGSCMRVYC